MKHSLLFFILGTLYLSAYCQDFDPSVIDVPLPPYSKNESHTSQTDYTIDEIKNMFKVISQRFSKVFTSSTGAQQNGTEKTSDWTYVGGTVGPIMALVLLVMLVALWIRFNKLRNLLSGKEISQFLYGYSSGDVVEIGENRPMDSEAHTKPYDQSIEIPKDGFEINWSSMLGSGAFGFVCKATIKRSGCSEVVEVALKMTKDNCPKSAVMSLLSEIKILSYLGKHMYLVGIQGAYTAEIRKGIVYVATELCGLGSLKDYLKSCEMVGCGVNGKLNDYQNSCISKLPKLVSFEEMIRWAFEIASGMEYLAGKNVVHADLAARNVLLTDSKIAKITDFGLSRRLYDYTNYVKKQQEPLPWRWMAIEALKKLEFSTQSDVWSYGVTLWELFSMGDVPYPGLSWTMDFVVSLENGLRMNCPKLANPDIYNQMIQCWDNQPQMRPIFSELKEFFELFMKNHSN